MTRDEFRAILGPLVLTLRAEFDAPTWTAYYRALEDVPGRLLVSAVDRAIKSATFMPKPGELRTLAEEARKALLQMHPYTGCADCEAAIGWRPRLDAPNTVERCPCHARHQQQLTELGVTREPLALPARTPDWTEAHAD